MLAAWRVGLIAASSTAFMWLITLFDGIQHGADRELKVVLDIVELHSHFSCLEATLLPQRASHPGLTGEQGASERATTTRRASPLEGAAELCGHEPREGWRSGAKGPWKCGLLRAENE